MKKQEFEDGIKEYIEKYDEKIHSQEVKDLHEKFIQPILDKSNELFLAENDGADWCGSFFQGVFILARVGYRKKAIYREKEFKYSTDYLILELSE